MRRTLEHRDHKRWRNRGWKYYYFRTVPRLEVSNNLIKTWTINGFSSGYFWTKESVVNSCRNRFSKLLFAISSPIMEKLRKKSYRCDFQCVLGKRFIFRQLDDIRLYSMTLDIIFVTRWNIILITMRHRTHYSIIYLCNRVNISFIRHFIIILCFIHTISYNVKKIATPYLPSLEYPTLKHLSLPSSAKIFLKHLIINKAEWSITKLEKSDLSFIIIFRVALSKILSPFNITITWNSKEWFGAYASILGAYRVMNQNVKTYGSTLTHISKNSRYFHVHYIP